MSGSTAAIPLAAPDLGAADLPRLVIRLAWPAMLGLSANAAHHAANAVFVGMIGVEAIAAVTVTLPLVILVAAVGEGLGVGVATTIGRFLGARRRSRAGVAASTVVALAVPIGVILTVGLVLAREPLLLLFGASSDTLALGSDYLRVVAFGATLILLQIVCDFIAIGEGNTRFSMWTLIGGFGLNVALDPILIFGLGLGVAGAALATVLSQCAVLAAYAFYFARRLGQVRVMPRLVRLHLGVLRPILAIGVPAAAASGLTAVAFGLVSHAAAAHGGGAGLAAIGLALRVVTLGTLPVFGFALGAQSIVSYAWGADDRPRAAAAARFMVTVLSGFCVVYAGLVMGFARPIAGLFTADPAVQDRAVQALVAAHLAFPFAGLRAVALVVLQAMGRARLAALLGLAPNGYLLILALAVLAPRFGLSGDFASLWVSAAGATLLTGLIGLHLRAAFQHPPERRARPSHASCRPRDTERTPPCPRQTPAPSRTP